VATLYCPCGQAHELWGEFWWTEGYYQWVFFDYEQTSETYAEQVDNCPACGRRLERENLLSGLSNSAPVQTLRTEPASSR
jgi:hypothetical protein